MSNHNNNNNNNNKTMTTSVLIKRAILLGSSRENDFTDELLRRIAASAGAETGKKVKVKLSSAGLRITRSRFLKSDSSQFYPFDTVMAVTRNPSAPRCVMFILSDPQCKYHVIAVKCALEVDASDLINFAARLRKEQQVSNVEFKKRDNGNWTLRERSAHNANRHMAELFNRQSNGGGGVTVTTPTNTTVITTVENHVPVLDASRNRTVQGSFVKRQHSSSVKRNGRDSAELNEYIVETEVETGERPQDITALKGQVSSLTHEVEELRALVQQNNMSDVTVRANGRQAQPGEVSVYSHGVKTDKKREVLPSRPKVQTTVTSVQQQQQQQPVVYRAAPVTYEARVVGPTMGYFADPWGPQRRVSGSFTLPHQNRGRTDSFQGSNKVTFDRESIVSTASRKSRSLRSIPTTIERSIEDTYARPVILRRPGSVQMIGGGRARPVSYHVMGTNDLQVFNARGRNQDDVQL